MTVLAPLRSLDWSGDLRIAIAMPAFGQFLLAGEVAGGGFGAFLVSDFGGAAPISCRVIGRAPSLAEAQALAAADGQVIALLASEPGLEEAA